MNIPMNQFPSIEQMTDRLNSGHKVSQSKQLQHAGIPFEEILKSKQAVTQTAQLRFSKHANERLASRDIDLTDDQLERLELGTRKAGEKGIKESLVMVDNLSFIVNVKNNMVITAVNEGEEKVFTNIDGAVII